MTLSAFFAVIIVLWSFIYTFSFGIWTWKRKNKLGALMVFVLASMSIAFPVFLVFFRGE